MSNIKYLVIAPAAFQEGLKPLLEERRKNYEVVAVTPEEIYAKYPQHSRPAAIQNFVRDLYRSPHPLPDAPPSSHPLKYLLLVGDDASPDIPNEIPIGEYPGREKNPGTENSPAISSDAFYGDMAGDVWPEIAVGRIPAREPKEVKAFVEKILNYEKNHSSVPFSRLSFYAGVPGFGAVSDLLLEGLVYALIQRRVPKNFPIDLHYDEKKSAFNSERSFREMLNAGAFAFTYLGHGAPEALVTREPFSLAEADKINITGEPPILNLMACSAGCFAGKDCLGEKLVLKEKGPVAVIGSNEVISPLTLQFFGDAMAPFLEKPEGATLGDVFLKGQRGMENEKDLLWRLLALLPAEGKSQLYLKGEIREALRRQGLQMTLLGDPATPWRPKIPKDVENLPAENPDAENLPAFDVRAKGPKTDIPFEKRIVLEESPAAASASALASNVLSSKELSAEDLKTVLSIFDYFAFRAPAYLGEEAAQFFPQAGEVTVEKGIFNLPFKSERSITLDKLPPKLRLALFPGHVRGRVTVEKNVQFSVRAEEGKVILEDIAGITLKPSTGPARALTRLAIQYAEGGTLQAAFELPPVSAEDAAALNERFQKFFEGQTAFLKLEHDSKKSEAYYSLWRHIPSQKKPKSVLQLHRFDLATPPQFVEGKGVILKLPFGKWVHQFNETQTPPNLVLVDEPLGEKTESSLFIPLAERKGEMPERIGEEDLANLLFEKLKLSQRPAPISLSDPRLWPVFAFYTFADPAKIDLEHFALEGGKILGAGPLFRDFEGGPAARGDTEEGQDSQDSPGIFPGFSLGDLWRTGAEICLVVDGTGSVGAPMSEVWNSVERAWEDLQFRSLVSAGLVVAQNGAAETKVPLSTLTEEGMEKLSQAVDNIPFRGSEESLNAGIETCRKMVEPDPDGSTYRGIFVLTDREGNDNFTDNRRVASGVYKIPVDVALNLPEVGEIFKRPEAEQTKKKVEDFILKRGVAPERAKRIAEILAPLKLSESKPVLAVGRQINETWDKILAAALNESQVGPPSPMEPGLAGLVEGLLSSGAVTQQTEAVTMLAVRAVPLLSDEEATNFLPQLESIVRGSFDEALKKAAAETIGKLARAGDRNARRILSMPSGDEAITRLYNEALQNINAAEGDEAMARMLYDKLQEDPDSVSIGAIRACGRTNTTMEVLEFVIDYSTSSRRAWALQAMQEILIPRGAMDRSDPFRLELMVKFHRILRKLWFLGYPVSDLIRIAQDLEIEKEKLFPEVDWSSK